MNAFQQGFNACVMAVYRNPYHEDMPSYNDWENGWNHAWNFILDKTGLES